MDKILMTEKEWKEIEEKSKSVFFYVSFLIDSTKISIQKMLHKDKFYYSVYIDGKMKGAETEENKQKYWFEKRSLLKKDHKKYYADMARLHTGEEKKKYQELSKQTVTHTYFIPYFGSFKGIKSAYKKRHPEIFLLEEGSYRG